MTADTLPSQPGGQQLAKLLFALLFTTSCGSSFLAGEYSLVDRFAQASRQFSGGRYPDFVEEPSAAGAVDIGGDIRESLTPPFPSRLSFDLEVPGAAFLEFSTALMMVQDVRRARVEFRITVEEGVEVVEVYRELLRADSANQWHDRELDLSRWVGKSVVLTLQTRAVPPQGGTLWAERIQTIWGDPILSRRPGKVLAARVARAATESIDWLGRWFDTTGITPDQQVMSWGFGLNLVLGGLLSIVVRELYKSFSSTLSNREAFANMLPLFTLATITVVSVVQYSPALALGLVGALSVIRFRAAIASGEELVYLLLCVGLGVAIGANHLPLAMVTVVVVAPFIFLRRPASKRHVEDNLMLTLSAQTTGFFDDDGGSVVDVVRNMTKGMTVERLEHSSGQVLFRARIQVENADQVVDLLTALRTRVSECQVGSAGTNLS